MEILIIQGFADAGYRIILEKISKALNYDHLSLINLIRQELEEATSKGQLFRSYMDKGELLPASLVQELVENGINKCVEKEGISIDGYPRTPQQAELLLDFLLQNPNNKIKACFLFTPKEVFITRWKSTHHWDDSYEALILERLNNFEREANELKIYLESRIEVMTIDGVGTIDEISNRLLTALKFDFLPKFT